MSTKTMSKFSLLIFLTLWSSFAQAADGAMSGGGGGGEVDPNKTLVKIESSDRPQWIASLLKQDKTSDLSLDYSQLIERSQYPSIKAAPALWETCFKQNIPVMPSVLDKMIEIKFSTLSAENSPVLIEIDQSSFCKKDIPESLNQMTELQKSFVRFRYMLADLSLNDPSSTQFLETVYSLGGPITVVITDHDFGLPALVGTLHERSYYDQTQKSIYWHSSPASNSLYRHFERSPIELFRHELTHVLIARQMGDQYPQLAHWHVGDLADRKYLLHYQTSEIAAYIEGLAAVFEFTPDSRLSSHNHPYLSNTFTHTDGLKPTPRVTTSGETKTCFTLNDSLGINGREYSATEETAIISTHSLESMIFPRDTHGNLAIPIANESYVSSMLFHLIACGPQNTHSDCAQPSKQAQLLKALIRSRATNLKDLAKAYDLVSSTSEGFEWLKQNFWIDYQTGLSVAPKLVKTELRDDYPNTFGLCY